MLLIQDNLDQQLESTAVAQHTKKTLDDRPGPFDKERAGHLKWLLESQTMAEKRGSGKEPQMRSCAMSERVLGLSGKEVQTSASDLRPNQNFYTRVLESPVL